MPTFRPSLVSQKPDIVRCTSIVATRIEDTKIVAVLRGTKIRSMHRLRDLSKLDGNYASH